LIISAIVAAAKNRVIGRNNTIPWYLQADLKFFKKTTLNHHVIMGRNSFESIGRPLPNRTNIVITRNTFFAASGCVIMHSIPEALAFARDNGETEVFIIGGGEIYKQALPYLNRIYLTEVQTEIEGDVYFPKLDQKGWRVSFIENHEADEKNDYAFTIKVLDRIEKRMKQ
jgi:dihydrofolate reductase